MLYFFRNQKQGAGPCAPPSCQWGPSAYGPHGEREGGCLAGNCSESTVANVPTELVEIFSWMPAGRPLVFGIYAGGHSSLGSPTARYVDQVLELVLSRAEVAGGGVMLWPLLAPCGGVGPNQLPAPGGAVCTDTPVAKSWYAGTTFCIELCAKGCAVRDRFAQAAAWEG